MSDLPTQRITEMQLRDTVNDDVNFAIDDGIQSYRATAAKLWNYFQGKAINSAGDLIYGATSTTLARLGIGSAQQILRPVAGVPAWAWPHAVQRTATTTDSINATTDHIVLFNASGGAFIATLPTAASVSGKTYILKKIGTDFNAVTIATTSSQTIDGVVGSSLNTPGEILILISDGSNWVILKRQTSFSFSEAWADNQSNATTNVTWSRSGNRIFIKGKTTYAGAQSGALTVTIPTHALPDSTTYPFASNMFYNLGSKVSLVDTSTAGYAGLIYLSAASTLTICQFASTFTNLSSSAPFTWTSGDFVEFEASWVVANWKA